MEDFIPTRCSKVKTNAVENFISVNYKTPKKVVDLSENSKAYLTESITTETALDRKRKQEVEMKKARYDVIKFGITAFQGEEAKEAKTALAIRLGAKPPKNKSINYKVLQAERKKQEEKRKKGEHVSGLMQSMKKYKKKKAYKKETSNILGVYGKVSKDMLQNKN